jgi:hypothetical protein
MSLAILFHFLCTQQVSDINISIIRSLRLCYWITTLVDLFLFRCGLEIWCGWFWVVFVLQAEAKQEQDRCGNSTTQSQAPDDGCWDPNLMSHTNQLYCLVCNEHEFMLQLYSYWGRYLMFIHFRCSLNYINIVTSRLMTKNILSTSLLTIAVILFIYLIYYCPRYTIYKIKGKQLCWGIPSWTQIYCQIYKKYLNYMFRPLWPSSGWIRD